MASLVKKATLGYHDATIALYNANKQTLYRMAQCLLPDPSQAAAVTAAAFQDILAGLKNAKFTTSVQFANYAVFKLANHCKNKTLQKNPKALRVPHDKSFLLTNLLPVKNTEDELEYVLSAMPALHRYIFVLHTLGNLSSQQIGTLLQIDENLTADAIDAEEENISRIQDAASQEFDSSYAQLKGLLQQSALEAEIPESMEQTCLGAIQTRSAAEAPKLKKRKVITWVISIAAVICLGLIAFAALQKAPATPAPDVTQQSEALDPNLIYYADIDIAEYGKITVKLDQENAPQTVANFVNLAKSGFYNGLTFHRIMEGFMMQGGCPDGNGGGSAEKNVVGEFSANGYTNNLSHTRGVISMARADDYNSGSCQFFIVHQDSTFLDGQYASFGQVTEGMDVVDAVCTSAQPTDSNGTIPAAAQPVIKSITIRTEAK